MTVAVGRYVPRILWTTLGLAVALTAGLAPDARADEQRVSRLGLALSAMVTSLDPNDVNEMIEETNVIAERDFGINTISEIRASAYFQAEARFFISDRFVATAGLGRIRRTSELALMPQLDNEVLIQGRVSGVTRHLGLDYYFAPYTSGDVTLRPFAGGGFMDVVDAKLKVGGGFESPDTTFDDFTRGRGEGSGFYLEGGVQLMLPSRYSFIANLHYRHLKVDELLSEDRFGNVTGRLLDVNGDPAELDLSGFGLRLAINIDILDRF